MKGRLRNGEKRLLLQLADTGRKYDYDHGDHMPEMISLELALRLAEKSYRRGFQQGAYSMRSHILPESVGEWFRPGPRLPGHDFFMKITNWRFKGLHQNYASGECPPGRWNAVTERWGEPIHD